MQKWADDLKLDKYFELISEDEYRNSRTDVDSLLESIEKDPYGLDSDQSFKKKEMEKFQKTQEELGTNMAVAMFMVDAFEYFDNLSIEKVRKIAYEIALVGTQGINPQQKNYAVGLIPGKLFSGYHLLAYYYVSWALAEPDKLEMLGLPYKGEYQIAKTMFKSKR